MESKTCSDPQGVGFCSVEETQGLSPLWLPSHLPLLGGVFWGSVMFLYRTGEQSLNYTPDHFLLQTLTQILRVLLRLSLWPCLWTLWNISPADPYCWGKCGSPPTVAALGERYGDPEILTVGFIFLWHKKEELWQKLAERFPKVKSGGWWLGHTLSVGELSLAAGEGLLWVSHAQESLSLTENCTAKVWFKIKDMICLYKLLYLVVRFFWVTQISSWLRFGKPSSCKCHPQ